MFPGFRLSAGPGRFRRAVDTGRWTQDEYDASSGALKGHHRCECGQIPITGDLDPGDMPAVDPVEILDPIPRVKGDSVSGIDHDLDRNIAECAKRIGEAGGRLAGDVFEPGLVFDDFIILATVIELIEEGMADRMATNLPVLIQVVDLFRGKLGIVREHIGAGTRRPRADRGISESRANHHRPKE